MISLLDPPEIWILTGSESVMWILLRKNGGIKTRPAKGLPWQVPTVDGPAKSDKPPISDG